MIKDKKIGIVVMFKIDSGGGGPRVVVDLIKALNSFGYKIHFLTPWKLNHEKIEKLFEPIKIEKEYNAPAYKLKFFVEKNFSRKLMKKEFINMAENVDFIIDVDGGVLDRYLPENKKYIIWRISGIDSETIKEQWKNWKMVVKRFIKKTISPQEKTLPLNKKIYAVDEWTKNLMVEKWHLKPERLCLYPAVKTKDISYKPFLKKNQAIVLGRISPNKMIEESIRIFAIGANENDYKLKIVGGITPDSEDYKEYLENIAKEEGILERLEFIGNPSFDELRKNVEESKILIEAQRNISLTMTSIECLAAGVVVLVYKNGGTYKEVLDNGKYGVGFESIEESGYKLNKIIKGLSINKINPEGFIKRAEFFSEDKFRERLKIILKENEI
ncbi:glycosyltransferase family 4 protein [Candidatus Pacearchaeota archaeon]|nr:glycosyltransferase family 4 protein [Candidatus Pacearchaeota archaeon]